ncbi:uncharacterized protein [Littorina saxatilis]|uniref:uncharacterized protein n=1 Tax=Littorina saxatilis TaxID=31220 RepID=UPI0038B6329F
MGSSAQDQTPDILQNLTLVYEPQESIRLLTPYTKLNSTLTVQYKWLIDNENCSKESDVRCEDVSPEGPCSPCLIHLPVYDRGYCQYRDQGSVASKITFTLSIHDVSESRSFYPLDWIKPGPVDSIHVQQRGSSWLTLTLSPPTHFDQCHLQHANGPCDNSLVFNYTVDLVSLKEQSLLQEEGRLFYETYGFVRNLEDDELALSQTGNSAFTQHSQPNVWESTEEEFAHHPSSQSPNVTQLPLAGYHYNISVQTQARYPGGTVWIRNETAESAPEEGPQLHDSFAYCPLTSEHCATCIIYFKEIPRPKKGGVVLNHTLTLTLLNPDAISTESTCGNDESKMETSTGGHNNTFHIPSLPVGAEYTVSLQAFNSKGPSPSTTAVLHVRASAPPFAAEDIVVESSGASYDVSWRPGQESSDIKVRYTVHTCWALPLQLSGEGSNHTGPSLPPQPLNCVTNMVSKELPEDHTNSLTFDDVPRVRGLTPVFFLSTTTPTNLTTDLLPVDCFYFYVKNRAPAKVTSLESRSLGNKTVEVKFQLPCGQSLDYKNGRPHSYAIGVAQRIDTANCYTAITPADLHFAYIENKVLQPVVYHTTNLTEDTEYCVCVYLFGRNVTWDRQVRSLWTCNTFKTGLTPQSASVVTAVVITVVICFFIATVFIIVVCRRRYQRNLLKFPLLSGQNHDKSPEEISMFRIRRALS